MKPNALMAVVMTAIFALPLAGCGGRAADRAQIVQEQDFKMSCEELEAEIAKVGAEYLEKQREADKEEEHNLTMGVGTMIPFVGLAAAIATDAQRGALIEALALRDRLDRLERIADRRCDRIKRE